ncbi:MAG: hypothetical protein CO042_00620 [Parcubacteria group bacterium CG_4_9_14_0_2_um_filter_41_8]|nr:MAG: hypothetical protein AUJ34_00325 [Parcubacteria group bacterium CG1_02_41_12]PIP67328.1 MAG: hypothetical protein COW93_00725 [Parcubacteria group bacterium CG22_combo_CG10-13_8_21_14_all_41_9]PIQ77966.1 MAG: hypothetical protein COV79_05745 [Parcubacteria group bacterium CG11_big_fil_rev_8_21_14_0_20_41_14]PJC41026.1 MAG: hypothetical protein CO042_00620 [Parcubacteria group bacterium CG_4_9_14_0_2_um_filter_41_8]
MKKENYILVAVGTILLTICVPTTIWLHGLAKTTQPIWYDGWGWFNAPEFWMGIPSFSVLIGVVLILAGLTKWEE